MNTIDKLTLELLMNRSLWSKTMEHNDPYKIEEQNIFKQKLKRYKIRILQMLTKYLENPELNINTEMDEIFEVYAKENIKYFEMNDLAIERFYTDEGECEGECEDKDDIEYEENNSTVCQEDDSVQQAAIGFSCWSNDKVKKLPTKYTMDRFVKRK